MAPSRVLQRTAAPALVAGAAVLLAGAGGSSGPHAATERPAATGEVLPAPTAVSSRGGDGPGRASPADTTVVGMTNALAFAPEKITIRAGETVVWRNTSVLVHTVTAIPDSASDAEDVQVPDGAEPFGSGRLAPDESYRRVFTVPGTYRYFCIPHEAAGMTGTVVVKEEP